MPWVGFEPTISAGERPYTYALDRAATGTGVPTLLHTIKRNTEALLVSSNEFGLEVNADKTKYMVMS